MSSVSFMGHRRIASENFKRLELKNEDATYQHVKSAVEQMRGWKVTALKLMLEIKSENGETTLRKNKKEVTLSIW